MAAPLESALLVNAKPAALISVFSRISRNTASEAARTETTQNRQTIPSHAVWNLR